MGVKNRVKLTATLPEGHDVNGLEPMYQQLVDHPEGVFLALVWMDCKETRSMTDTAEQVPYTRIRRIEPLGQADDQTAAIQELALQRAEARLGRTPLPFDQVEVATSAPLPDED